MQASLAEPAAVHTGLVRIAEYREGHISRSHEYDEYIAWFIDRGIRTRNAINTYLDAV